MAHGKDLNFKTFFIWNFGEYPFQAEDGEAQGMGYPGLSKACLLASQLQLNNRQVQHYESGYSGEQWKNL